MRAGFAERARGLGEEVAARWDRRGRRPQAFGAIALRALRERRLHEGFDREEVLRWTLQTPRLPRQYGLHSEFGQPPLTLYWDDEFVVDLLFWSTPAASIHDHSFGGAFTLLEGAALQCDYRFETQEDAGRIAFGALTLKAARLLAPGATQSVQSGERSIHSVRHLSRPSVSLVVRPTRGAGSRHDYLAPGLRLDSEALRRDAMADERLVKRRDLLRFLVKTDPRAAAAGAREMLRSGGVFEAYLCLSRLFEAAASPEVLEPAAAAARRRHGEERVGLIMRALELNRPAHGFPWKDLPEQGSRLLLSLLFSPAAPAKIGRLLDAFQPAADARALLARAESRGLLSPAVAAGYRRRLP